MAAFLEIARTGLDAVLLHPLRSVVTVAALVAVLLPYLAGQGLCKGLEDEAEASVQFGADLYLTARQYGRPVPIPLSVLEEARRIPGVVEVVPRIVGAVVLGKDAENAVVVGMPLERFPAAVSCVRGRLPAAGKLNELVMGTALARRLRVEVGAYLPPFYHSAEGERISQVVGLFTPEVGLWQANLLFTSFDTAAHLFDQKGTATDLLVYCRPGYANDVAAALTALRLPPAQAGQSLRPHVTARADAAALLSMGVRHREGLFQLHFLLAIVVSILVLLVTSGFGLTARRREIGILKATGWQTDEILLRSAVESVLLALAGISLSVLLAYLWLRGLNGYWIASLVLSGVDVAPGFRVPYRLTPIPVLLAFVIGLVVVLSGTLYSAWRAATVPPIEAMR